MTYAQISNLLSHLIILYSALYSSYIRHFDISLAQPPLTTVAFFQTFKRPSSVTCDLYVRVPIATRSKRIMLIAGAVCTVSNNVAVDVRRTGLSSLVNTNPTSFEWLIEPEFLMLEFHVIRGKKM